MTRKYCLLYDGSIYCCSYGRIYKENGNWYMDSDKFTHKKIIKFAETKEELGL